MIYRICNLLDRGVYVIYNFSFIDKFFSKWCMELDNSRITVSLWKYRQNFRKKNTKDKTF